jgi:hypothetical protein
VRILLSSEVKELKERKWELGAEYDGCFTIWDVKMILRVTEQIAMDTTFAMLERGEIEEVRVPDGHARMFRFFRLVGIGS